MEVVTRTRGGGTSTKNSTLDVESAREARREEGGVLGNIRWINCDKMDSAGEGDREGGVPTG